MTDKYEAVIGLEVHAQLLTKSKAFCTCPNRYGDIPNTLVCPICLGHPGTLPVLNEALVEGIVKMGLATNCKLREISGFARKNYFYQDLPKGYQITQFDDPICYDGYVEIEEEDGSYKKIGVTRIHMEEDTGKSNHDLDIDTLVDLNRAGVPLIEIVSEPDIRNAEEAYKYLSQIKNIVLYLGICTGNMEEGALRCDANVSVRLKGAKEFGTKAEVKNMNSFRNVEKAIDYEIKRQIELIESGGKVSQETRQWDAGSGTTKSMRSKESSHDYRYFPEPDLLKVQITNDTKETLFNDLPELPLARKQRFMKHFGLTRRDAGILTEDKNTAEFFENCCELIAEKTEKRFKVVNNWIQTEVLRIKAERKVEFNELDISPNIIAELADLQDEGLISNKIAKDIFPECVDGKLSPKALVEERGLKQNSDSSQLDAIVKQIIEANPENVAKFKAGQFRLEGFFVGQVMKETKGSANPGLVAELVKKYLES